MSDPLLNLNDLLIDSELITKPRIEQAVSIAKDQGVSLFQVLIEQSFVGEQDLLEYFSQKLDVPFELVDKATVDHKVSTAIPENFARDHSVLGLFKIGDQLTTAFTDPFDLRTIEELEVITQLRINPILTLKSNLEPLFSYCYSYQEVDSESETTSMSSLFEMGMKLMEDKNISDEEIYDLAQEAPIAKLVDTIIRQSITEKASDIHIEPEENSVKIRFRIDGMLKDMMTPPKKLENPIISRLKILANLDITETRKPQDGRLTFSLKEKDIDFRVSTVRTISGEKMVLRVLDKSGAFVTLDKLGLNEQDYRTFNSLIHSTSGIVIVCGPTGSGKTSSLYSALSRINTPEKNIITIEDPVEFNLDGINQIPVNQRIGMDFVTGLSAIVRQDPDVIMVGEVRDLETASIAIQAALTGHMVFTTLHTRDAAGTVTRLLDMGIAPFLLNSSINGVIGQRLIRSCCPNCKKPVPPPDTMDFKQQALLKELAELSGKSDIQEVRVYRGDGCKFCDGTGYKGRTGIFEVLTMTENVRQLIGEQASSEKIRQAAIESGMSTMKQDGLNKVLAGISTLEELARVLDL